MSEKNEEDEEILIATDRCLVKKKQERLVAKCEGTEEVDLGKLAAAETQDEECPECAAAIALGWAVQYIKPLDSVVAKELEGELKNDLENINPDAIMDRCLDVARKAQNKPVENTLLDLKELMNKPIKELEEEAGNSGGV